MRVRSGSSPLHSAASIISIAHSGWPAVTAHNLTQRWQPLMLVASGDDRPMQGAAARSFRSVCMRASFLARDWPCIQFAGKEASRHMA